VTYSSRAGLPDSHGCARGKSRADRRQVNAELSDLVAQTIGRSQLIFPALLARCIKQVKLFTGPVNAILAAPSQVRLDKGKNVLTVHIFTLGNMNLAHFDFKPVHR
jgi:hypothetical protein